METALLLWVKHGAVKVRGCLVRVSDDSESELDHPRRRKGAALEVDGVPHALRLIGELLNPR